MLLLTEDLPEYWYSLAKQKAQTLMHYNAQNTIILFQKTSLILQLKHGWTRQIKLMQSDPILSDFIHLSIIIK